MKRWVRSLTVPRPVCSARAIPSLVVRVRGSTVKLPARRPARSRTMSTRGRPGVKVVIANLRRSSVRSTRGEARRDAATAGAERKSGGEGKEGGGGSGRRNGERGNNRE